MSQALYLLAGCSEFVIDNLCGGITIEDHAALTRMCGTIIVEWLRGKVSPRRWYG